MWSKFSSALKPRDGNDGDPDAQPRPPPDPFHADATTYYTQQTPPTPPLGVHSRTASREEDIIWSLRTQLTLQRELCAQFEIDLGARDELVQELAIRLEASEKENEKRKSVVRSWKKKTVDLEKMCRHLEEEVDISRQESVERSIMDEASGEALRQLHRQISQLERERNDVEAERKSLTQVVQNAEAEITRLERAIGTTDEADGEAVRQLRHQISQLERQQSDVQGECNTLAQAVEKAEIEALELREELDTTNKLNKVALHRLHDQISQLEREKSDVEAAKLKEALDASDEANREALSRLHDRISQLERQKSDVEAERNTLTRQKSEAEAERNILALQKSEVEADVLKLKGDLNITNDVNVEALLQLERKKGELETEMSRLRAHVQQLQKDNATMEVTIVQLNKQLDQDKEDIYGLNIALESKQQELELVKRKHGTRSAVGPTPGRTVVAPFTTGKPVGNSVPPSKILRTSAVGPRTSSPVPPRVPLAPMRATNTKPPVSSTLRRASSSSVESKTKLSSRRLSVTSMPSEADEKENASAHIALKHPIRGMVPA